MNNNDGTVSVLNGATHASPATLDTTVPAGANPAAIAVDPVTNLIYVSSAGDGTLTVLDGASNTVTATLSAGYSSYGVTGIAVNPVTNLIYAANPGLFCDFIFNGLTPGPTPGFNWPTQVLVNPVTNVACTLAQIPQQVYFTLGSSGSSFLPQSATEYPNALGLNPLTNQLYVTSWNGVEAMAVPLNGGSSGSHFNPYSPDATFSGPTAVAVNPLTNQVYVANFGNTSLTAFTDPPGLAVASGLPLSQGYPIAVAVNPLTNKIYVANANSNSVSVVDGSVCTTAPVSLGQTPAGLAVNPVTGTAYVINPVDASPGIVAVIDLATNIVTHTVTVGHQPQAVALNAVTNQIYVTNFNDNTVSVLDGTSNTLTATVPVGAGPTALAVNPATNQIYVTNNTAGSVSVIDGASHLATTVAVDAGPTAVAVDSTTNWIYVVNSGGNDLSVLDGFSNLVTQTLAVGAGPAAVAADPVLNQVYVANGTDGTVSVIQGATRPAPPGSPGPASLLNTVTVGSNPGALAVDPVTSAVYVTNNGSNNVSVLNGAGAPVSLAATVSTGSSPTAIALNPMANRICVANSGSGNVTMIDGASNVPVNHTVGAQPLAVAVNPCTNEFYVANFSGESVSAMDVDGNHPLPNPLPLPLTVAGNDDLTLVTNGNAFTSMNPSPTITVTATSNFSATAAYLGLGLAANPPATILYYWVDDGSFGSWAATASTGNPEPNQSTFTVSLPSESFGSHNLYLTAGYGDEGVSSDVFNLYQNTTTSTGQTCLEIGHVQAVPFVILPMATTSAVAPQGGYSQSVGSNPVTLAATVTAPGWVSPAASPTGQVSFYDGTTLVGTGTLSGAGGTCTASCTATLASGSHTLGAVYLGDSIHGGSSAIQGESLTIYGAAHTVQVVSGDSQSQFGGVPYSDNLEVRVVDSLGSAVSNVNVVFSGAGLSFTGSTTVTTDGSGLASIQATPQATGPLTVTAAVGSVTGTFTENVTAGPAAAISVVSGNNQSVAYGTAYAPMVVQVVDSNGIGVPGASVTFPAVSGLTYFGANVVSTGSNGQASITAIPVGAGPFTITASINAGAHSTTFTENMTPGTASHITDVSGSNKQSGPVGAPYGNPLAVLVTDDHGVPVPGVTVTFTPAGLNLSSGTALTLANGQASVTATPTLAGTPSALASINGGALSVGFTETATVGTAAQIIRISGNGQSGPAGITFANPLVVQVLDGYGNPVPGVTATFAPAGLSLSAPTATTGSTGLAFVTATPIAAGTPSVVASITGGAAPVTFTATATVGTPAAITVVSGNGQNASAGTAYGNPLVVLVTDRYGEPLPGVSVAFAGSGLNLSAATALSQGNGQASVTATPTLAGNPTATASINAGASSVGFAETATAGAAANLAVVSGSGQSGPAGTAFGKPLMVLVTDRYGNPVPGVTVTYAPAGLSLSATTATTGSSGLAWVTATPIAAGTPSVVASITGGAAPVTFTATATVGAPASITVVSGNGQNASAGTAYGNPLGVLVTDRNGQPVPGASVAFAGSGLDLSAATALTQGNGQASVTATPTLAGNPTATASINGGPLSVGFTESATAGAAANLAVASGSGQSGPVGTAFGKPLMVLVTDRYANPVPGVTVTFAPAGLSLSSPTATTGSSGLAWVTATPNVAGTPSVVASITGGAPPVTFTATATVGAPAAITVVSGNGQNASAGTPYGDPLVVLVTDRQGEPVPGVTVAFAGSGLNLSAATALTQGNGQASVTAIPTLAGNPSATASINANASSVGFTETATAGAAANLTVVSGNGQSGPAGIAFAKPLVVQVLDGYGNPVAGVPVSFAPAGLSLPATTATTGSNGLAWVTATPDVAGVASAVASIAGGAPPVTFTETARAAPPAATPTILVLTSSVNPAPPNGQITFTATVTGASATPTGSVAFLDGNTPLGAYTLASGVAAFTPSTLALGTHVITATYSGDALNLACGAAPLAETVEPALVVTAVPGALTVPNGGRGTTQFTLYSEGLLDAPILLAATGLPAGAQCVFSPPSVTVAGGPVTVNATVSTSAHPLATSRNHGGAASGTGALLACATLLLPPRRRWRMGRFLSCLVLVLGGFSGCSGRSGGAAAGGGVLPPVVGMPTPAGTYSLTITASAPGAIATTTTLQLTVDP